MAARTLPARLATNASASAPKSALRAARKSSAWKMAASVRRLKKRNVSRRWRAASERALLYPGFGSGLVRHLAGSESFGRGGHSTAIVAFLNHETRIGKPVGVKPTNTRLAAGATTSG